MQKKRTITREATLALAVVIGAFAIATVRAGEAVPQEMAEASWWYSALGGMGIIGTVFYGVLRIVWAVVRPFVLTWSQKVKLERAFLASEAAVYATQQLFTDELKEKAKDGKLTEDEAKQALSTAREYVVAWFKSQGVDILKEVGEDALNWLIEAALGKLKMNAALKAALLPLDALPLSTNTASKMAAPAVTVEDFG